MSAWLDAVRASSPRLRDIFLVHGERESQDAFVADLAARGQLRDAKSLIGLLWARERLRAP